MIDSFVLLTPVLLIAIVALMGFVGCQLVFPLDVPPGVVAKVKEIVGFK